MFYLHNIEIAQNYMWRPSEKEDEKEVNIWYNIALFEDEPVSDGQWITRFLKSHNQKKHHLD